MTCPDVFSWCLSGWPPSGPNGFEWKDDILVCSVSIEGHLKQANSGKLWGFFQELQLVPSLSREGVINRSSSIYGNLELAVSPSNYDWIHFWRLCEEIAIWSWPSNQGDKNVVDGLMYDLELRGDGRYVKSRGQLYGSPPGIREAVDRLHKELQLLVGWHSR